MYMPEMVPQPRPTDEKIKIDSLCIYVDRDAVSLIRGTEIDYVQKHAGVHQLVFNNPNADNVCGCGESFNLKEK